MDLNNTENQHDPALQKLLDDKEDAEQFPDGNNKEGNSEKLLFNGEPLIGTIEQAPHYLIDNEYILSGYRINFNTFWRIFKR